MKPSREQVLNGIGLLLLVSCFLLALSRVVWRKVESDRGGVTLRIAHWQLETGVNRAFDEIARAYEKLHPGVKIQQSLIPERVFSTWATTQLIGGTAPDLMQLGKGSNTDERLVRFFVPLTAAMQAPNPYNSGTDLAAVPWRETFLDGLRSAPSYNATLLEIYGAPLSIVTTRVCYNKDLYRRIMGTEETPRTYADFLEVCRRTARDGRQLTGRLIVPIAGSKVNAPNLTGQFFTSQTQRLWLDQLAGDDLTAGDSADDATRLSLIRGRPPLDSPEIVKGLEVVRDLEQFMQPGFRQLNREDATFLFTQGNALMITTGSYDLKSLMHQAPFPIGAFAIPLPAVDDPEYGASVIGPTSEAGAGTTLAFGLTANSRNRETALDFLKFLTSQRMNALFARESGWLPAVVGVEVPESLRVFSPILDGSPAGVRLSFGADTSRVVDTNIYRLASADASPVEFLHAIDHEYKAALRQEIVRSLRSSADNVARQDVLISALRRTGSGAANKISELVESQNQMEATSAATRLKLSELDPPSPAK